MGLFDNIDFIDNDGDGKDDRSGLTEREHRRRAAFDASTNASKKAWDIKAGTTNYGIGQSESWHEWGSNPLGSFKDNNGDGLDDATGMSYDELISSLYENEQGYVDQNNDGYDDLTGLNRSEFQQTTTSIWNSPYRGELDTWRDENRDGRHDLTNEPESSFNARLSNYGSTREQRGQEEAAAQQLAQDQGRWDQEREEYNRSGQRQRDLDAGKPDKYAPNTRPGHADANGPGGGNIQGGLTGARHADGTPNYTGDPGLDAWLATMSGDNGAAIQADMIREQRRRNEFEGLRGRFYNANDMTVDYETGAPAQSRLEGAQNDWSVAAQRDALRAMQDVYQSGGMTQADHARQRLARAQTGQATRAQREADMAALQARGMGNSGATVASMLNAQQSGTDALARSDAQMQIDAQQRALQAMQTAGSLGSQARGQNSQELSGIDAFNQWRHGLTTASRESRVDARRSREANERYITEGKTGWSPGRQEQLEDDEKNQRRGVINGALNAAGELIT